MAGTICHFFFQAEDGIRDIGVTGVQTCALPIFADTKIDLHVDPAGFLSDVASVWTPSGALGHVQGGQYSGYLFPMGPFFALGHALGLSDWLVGRLWLGTLMALGAGGVVRLVGPW